MRTLLFLLLLTALLTVPALSEEPTVYIATDLHYISPELTDNGPFFMSLVKSGDGKMMHVIDPLTDAFVAQVIAGQPDALILSGDLTFNGARRSHEGLAEKLRLIEAAGIPVLVIPGNHDVYCTAASRFEGDGYTQVPTVTSEEFAAIYADMGYAEAIARDPASLSYVFQLTPDWRVLMVDVNTEAAPGALTTKTLYWVQTQLAQASTDGMRVIAVSHQNLMGHNSLFTSGFVIQGAEQLAALYADSPVQLQFSGHMHMQHTQTQDGLTEIAVSSLAVSPNQYGVLTLGESEGRYRSESVDVAAWARQSSLTDAALLDFSAQSEAFFKDIARRQADALLGDMEGADDMADWFADLNAAYFSGRMDTAQTGGDMADAWQQSGTFMAWYITSILMEPPADHTRITIPWR